MATNIFVNLAVKNLDKTKEFFSNLGYTFNQQFTDDKAACMVISETIYAMLISEAYFKTFIPNKEISDTSKSKEVLLALSADSRQQVDELADKAIAAGGKNFRDPDDHGFMYSRSFEDLDGHVWEVFWMNPEHVQ
jgi:predicted lactoylglutathione lyase